MEKILIVTNKFTSDSTSTSIINAGRDLQQHHVIPQYTRRNSLHHGNVGGIVTRGTGFAHHHQQQTNDTPYETQDKLPGIHPQATQQNHYSEAAPRSSTANHLSSRHISPHEHSRGNIAGLEGFVQQSSFLHRGRAYSGTMSQPKQEETAIDREQRLGLVCSAF